MMATAVSSKPAAYPGKVKRPSQSYAQTGVNGVKPPQPSTTPTSSTNRPLGSKQPGQSAPNNAAAVNGLNGRPVAKVRKEPQKNGDAPSRLQRPSGKISATQNANGERRQAKNSPEPYVKTTPYILKKYANHEPSFTVHLHPTHFRFDQQDGSFPYNSEMKFIIEHIKAGTVPHDMVEELLRGGVRFYEGCLIVRVVDYKSVSGQSSTLKSSSGEKLVPFSLHNYTQHVTPSPYAPYPQQGQADQSKDKPGTASNASDKPSENQEKSDSTDETPEEGTKEAQSTTADGANGTTPPKPKVFTTVLHPTPRSLQAEVSLCALTPDPKATNRRPSAQNTSRTPTSASLPQSATPLSVNASSSDRGPPAKRQKMMVEPHELQEFESKLVRATAPPLYLDTVDSAEASQDLLKFLQSPLHCDKPPSPKIRRRTVAELAADEALAAEEERFMLIMDERLEPTASNSSGAPKSAAVDDQGGTASFEPRFSRFKTLENIRLQHEEKAKQEHERKLQQDQAKRQQQEAEKEKRRIVDQRQAEEHLREESRRRLSASQAAQAQAAQSHAMAAAQRRPPSQGNAALPQQVMSSQGPQSSPVVRNATPHASSPLAGHAINTQAGQAIPTSIPLTTQGAGSPPQAAAGLHHGHPGVMGHPMVASRSQQGQSGHGTPQMAQGTPAMSHVTPIMPQATPAQRMSHTSPNAGTAAPTPVMNNHAMTRGPQMNGLMTSQQQQAFLQRQMQLAQQQQNLPAGQQFSPQQVAQLHAQQNIQHHQQQPQMQFPSQQHQQQQQAYQAQMLRSQLAHMQMNQQTGQGQHPQQPQQPHPQMMAASQQANGGGQQPVPKHNGFYAQIYYQHSARLRNEMSQRYLSQYGPPENYPPNLRREYSEGIDKQAKQIVSELMRRDRETGNPRATQFAQMQAAHAQVQAQQQQQHQQGMMGK